MKISLKGVYYFILGTLILAPLHFVIADTQIFYVQTILIILLFVFYGFYKREVTIQFSSIPFAPDGLYYLYFGWVVISFLFNFLLSFDDFETQINRFVSMGITALLLSGFFIGKSLKSVAINLRNFVNGIYFTYLLVIVSIIFLFSIQRNLDLYLVRRIIGQRLPFVIAYVSVLATVYFFLSRPRRIYLFLLMVSGVVTVVASLTRAAYIQVFISFVILFGREIRKYFFKGLLVLAIVILVGFVTLRVFEDVDSIKQINSRVELLFDIKAQSQDDESGSFRLEMWKFLVNKLLDDPIRLMIGYGQLGPTHVAHEFVSSDGISGNNAHSQYLDIVVREGIIGLFIFLFLCYKSIALGFSISWPNDDVRLFALANSIGLIGLMFYGFFHETFRYPLFGFYFWLYLGILSRLVEIEKYGN